MEIELFTFGISWENDKKKKKKLRLESNRDIKRWEIISSSLKFKERVREKKNMSEWLLNI